MNALLQYFQSSLQRQLLLFLVPLVVIPTVLVAVILGTQSFNASLETLREAEVTELNLDVSRLNDALGVLVSDFQFLKDSPNVTNFAQAVSGGDVLQVAAAKTDLQNLYFSMMVSKPAYIQLRFIDLLGNELVRVDKDLATGKPFIIVERDLQNKADRGYFTSTISLPEGEIYVSPLDLNREGTPPTISVLEDGSIVPTLRYATPIFTTNTAGQRERAGMLITNVDISGILADLAPSNEGNYAFLVNGDGYFLYHSASPEITFGFESGIEAVGNTPNTLISDVLPLTVQDSSFELETQETENAQLLNYVRYTPPSAPDNYYWMLGIASDQNLLLTPVRNTAFATTAGVIVLGLISAFAVLVISRQITSPLLKLSNQADSLAKGQFDVFSDLDEEARRKDELGTLGRAFQGMSLQLRELLTTLEQRVQARTADLATSAEIASAANQIRELDDLISLTVNLVRDRFNFYYVQVYLINDEKTHAVLKDGTGYVGRRLLSQDHQLPLEGRSLVSTAIREKNQVLVKDTKTDSRFLSNALLPDTRSELVVPLVVSGVVIGALDIQHSESNAFEETETTLFATLADQLAVTFDNVNLIETLAHTKDVLQASTARMSAITRNFPNGAIVMYDHDFRYLLVDGAGLAEAGLNKEAMEGKTLDEVFPPETATIVKAAYQRALNGDEVTEVIPFGDLIYQTISLPVRDENDNIIAAMTITQNITERVRSEETIKRRAVQLETVAAVSAQASTNLDVPTLLNTVSTLTKERFGLYHAHIYLLDNAEKTLVLSGGAGMAGMEMVARKHHIPLSREHSLVARTARSLQATISNDISQEPDFLSNPLLPDTQSEMALPMIVAGELVGVMDVQSDQLGRFDEEDVITYATLASQVAVAVKNARLFKDISDIRSAIDEHSIVAITDQTGKITYANQKFSDISKFPLEEVIGQDHRIINSGYHSKEFIRDIWVTIANGKTWKGQIKNKAKGGSFYWVDTTIVPFLSDDGKPYQYIAIRTDITAQKSNEEQITRRASELETVSVISTNIAQQLNVEDLLWTVADLTKEQFHRYHAHIYILNEEGTELVLRAGAGQTGRRMVYEGYKIRLDHPDSIVAGVARELEPLVVGDVALVDHYLPNKYLPETRSEMAVPIVYGDKLIGVLDIQDSIPYAFNDLDIQVQQTFANQVATAIENARAFEQTQLLLRDITTVNQINEYLRGDEAVEVVIENAMKVAMGVLGANSAVYSEYDVQAQQWQGVAGTGGTLTNDVAQTFRDPAKAYPHGIIAVEKQRVVVVDNARFYPDFPQDYVDGLGIKSVLTLPVIAGDVRGAIFLNYTDSLRAFTSDELGLAENVASQISLGIGRRVATQQADKARQETARIFESSLDMLGSATFEGFFTNLNPSWEATLGYTIDELRAEPFLHFVHPEDIDETLKAAQELATGVLALNFINRYRCKDASYRWVSWNSSPDTENGLIHFVARDITSQKESTELVVRRARELETVSQLSATTTTLLERDELLDQVVLLTRDNFNLYHAQVYLLSEDGTQLVLAAGAGEVGQKMKELHHAISLNNQNSLVARAARTLKGVISNDVTLNPDFLPNPLLPLTQSEMAVPLVVGGELIGVLDVQSDERNRFDDEDVKIKTILADQVAVAVRNAEAFDRERRTIERLREVDRLKQEFLANMSHELRTPLNSIIGYSEVLIDGVDGELSEEAVEDVQAIYGSGKHLLNIINEILDLAKIEAGQMQLLRKPMQLTDVLEDIVHSSQILAKKKGVDLRIEQKSSLGLISADKVRMNQIMLNLVSNAVKFTEQGEVVVSYGTVENKACVWVQDTGIGMSAADLEVIFERFRQADGSSTRRAGGTGLGLTITRQLIEMHGGEIFVQSELDKGTTLWFLLPLMDVPETRQSEPAIGD